MCGGGVSVRTTQEQSLSNTLLKVAVLWACEDEVSPGLCCVLTPACIWISPLKELGLFYLTTHTATENGPREHPLCVCEHTDTETW
ncbi:hypothetical protein AMELA_G00152020 [Ameiurus melas]|uniref:Uncharacterized protein n=1 Tax=Ameiurus melas TaxID=219545 RepID=A0A7J6AI19_AMEME|nr:hypothetical protein AMELA_G00152020 [Ameiurus melas]